MPAGRESRRPGDRALDVERDRGRPREGFSRVFRERPRRRRETTERAAGELREWSIARESWCVSQTARHTPRGLRLVRAANSIQALYVSGAPKCTAAVEFKPPDGIATLTTRCTRSSYSCSSRIVCWRKLRLVHGLDVGLGQ
jgi:hypothetical protein